MGAAIQLQRAVPVVIRRDATDGTGHVEAPRAGHDATSPVARHQLRQLDSCLHVLEDAHERGETVVAAAVAERFHGLVPGLVPRMLISDALELVFNGQEQYLQSYEGAARVPVGRQPGRAGSRPTVLSKRAIHVAAEKSHDAASDYRAEEEALGPATPGEARSLTERIKDNMREASVLLLAAHRRHVWSALGYATWEHYVRSEFGLSRSRSYELLDHGRVIRAIQRAANLSGIPDISAYAAQEVKAHLPQLAEEIRTRTNGIEEAGARQVISQIIRELRAHGKAQRSDRDLIEAAAKANDRPLTRLGAARTPVDTIALRRAIEFMASLPPPEEVASLISEAERAGLKNLPVAVGWLNAFLRALECPATTDLAECSAQPASQNARPSRS